MNNNTNYINNNEENDIRPPDNVFQDRLIDNNYIPNHNYYGSDYTNNDNLDDYLLEQALILSRSQIIPEKNVLETALKESIELDKIERLKKEADERKKIAIEQYNLEIERNKQFRIESINKKIEERRTIMNKVVFFLRNQRNFENNQDLKNKYSNLLNYIDLYIQNIDIHSIKLSDNDFKKYHEDLKDIFPENILKRVDFKNHYDLLCNMVSLDEEMNINEEEEECNNENNYIEDYYEDYYEEDY